MSLSVKHGDTPDDETVDRATTRAEYARLHDTDTASTYFGKLDEAMREERFAQSVADQQDVVAERMLAGFKSPERPSRSRPG